MTRTLRAVYFSAALALAFASTSMAEIAGSTYNFSVSSTGGTAITSSPVGAYTDPANAGFCVGPPTSCGLGSGVSGSYSFATVDATHSTITFQFSGSTLPVDGTFSVDLGNFVTADGSSITGVTYGSGNLLGGDFSNVSWDSTDAVFTGTAGSGYNAIGGATVVFDVTTTAAAPEPASFALLGSALVGLGLMRRRMKSAR